MKKVLFVCLENSCRSQMAEAFAKVYGKGLVEAYSAGTRPSRVVNKDAVTVMKEDGIDISGNASKGFDAVPVKDLDIAVSMGCGDLCPFVPASAHLMWSIEDPKGKDLDFFRKVKEDIKVKVKRLLEEIK